MVVPMKIADVFADLPEVETERLLLRRLTPDDVFRGGAPNQHTLNLATSWLATTGAGG